MRRRREWIKVYRVGAVIRGVWRWRMYVLGDQLGKLERSAF